MPHLRTIIRDAVADRLKAAVPGVGGRVHGRTRMMRQWQPHDVPALVVTVSDGGSNPVTKTRPRAVRRDLAVSVDVLAAAPTSGDVEAVLDELAVEVEVALADPGFLPAVAHEWRLTSSGLTSLEGDDGELYAVLSTVFALQVASVEGRPDFLNS